MHPELITIASHPLFQPLSQSEILRHLEQGDLRILRYPKNAMIHQEEDPCTKLEVLLAGEAGLCRIDDEGRIYTVKRFLSGEVLGGHILFSRHPFYPMTVIAQKNCILLEVKAPLVLDLCQHCPPFLLTFLQLLSDNALILGTAVKGSRPRSIEEGLKHYLRKLSSQSKPDQFVLPISKKELAEQLGVNRSSLSKVFQRLKSQGILEWQGRTIYILNKGWLGQK